MAEIRERALWRGEVVTVIERKLRKVKIRDEFGFVEEVSKRDVKKLREDDERRKFTVA